MWRWGKGITLGPCPSTSAQSREDLSDMEANGKALFLSPLLPQRPHSQNHHFELSIFATPFTNLLPTTENTLSDELSSILSCLDDELYLKLF